MKRKEFSIRVTSPDVRDAEKFTQFSVLRPQEITLVVIETGSETQKLHFHAYIKTREYYTDTQIRQAIAKVYGVTGEDLSCKDPEAKGGSVEKCLAYICKGTDVNGMPEVLCNRGVDTQKYHDIYWTTNQETKRRRKEGKVMTRYEELKEACRTAKDRYEIADMCRKWYIGVHRSVNYRAFMDDVRKIIMEQDEHAAAGWEILRELNIY